MAAWCQGYPLSAVLLLVPYSKNLDYLFNNKHLLLLYVQL